MSVTNSATSFQERVYAVTSEIPRGKVASYGFLAKQLNCGSARAVGQALQRGPCAPDVPYHRVVAADRSIHGFSGQIKGAPVDRKRRLLEAEGVRFEAEGRIAPECMLSPESPAHRKKKRRGE
ncbi:MAG TPA: MGMT family protein [Chthoniobacterales bacterium]